jgi:hypothetical protein
MIVMYIVAALLIFNIFLNHSNRFVGWYYSLYKKLIKPKFKVGEMVMINSLEYEIATIVRGAKPYTYFCLPKSNKRGMILETWFHESLIKKKTGLLKELE